MSRKWSKGETKLLLNLYLKYKKDFRERLKKRTEIWQYIVQEFEQRGFKANYIKLDRKFRNMSRTYFNIKRQNKDSDPNWEYFSAMEEIFAGTLIPESSESMSFQDNESDSQHSVHIKTEELESGYPDVLMDEPNFNELVSSQLKEEGNEVNIENSSLANDLEAQRVQELRAIRISLEEANVIQRERNGLLQERNELMKQYLAAKFKYNQHLYN